MRTHDCEPTLTDRQVIQFCREGFLKLEGVVSREVRGGPHSLDSRAAELRWIHCG